MTGIDQFVLINDPARYCRSLGVFVADESVRASHAAPRFRSNEPYEQRDGST